MRLEASSLSGGAGGSDVDVGRRECPRIGAAEPGGWSVGIVEFVGMQGVPEFASIVGALTEDHQSIGGHGVATRAVSKEPCPDPVGQRQENFWAASMSLGVTVRRRWHRSQPAVVSSTFTERPPEGLVKEDWTSYAAPRSSSSSVDSRDVVGRIFLQLQTHRARCRQILSFMNSLDTSEVHGMRPDRGYRVYIDKALEISPTDGSKPELLLDP